MLASSIDGPGFNVFSKIQELFSFQQDVAATKKNPMCWLRRAEAEKKTSKPGTLKNEGFRFHP